MKSLTTVEEQLSTLDPEATQAGLTEVVVGNAEGGSMVAAVVVALLALVCVASALAYVIYRYMRQRTGHSLNFDNPVYKKTTTTVALHSPHLDPTAAAPLPHHQYGGSSLEEGLCEPMVNTLKY